MKPATARSPFIPETAIYATSPRYVRGGYDPYPVLGDRNAATDQVMEKLTGRARIAYSPGCSERVVFTLAPLNSSACLRPNWLIAFSTA
jgi:hypothetical protein